MQFIGLTPNYYQQAEKEKGPNTMKKKMFQTQV